MTKIIKKGAKYFSARDRIYPDIVRPYFQIGRISEVISDMTDLVKMSYW